jgi:hypothetical protein
LASNKDVCAARVLVFHGGVASVPCAMQDLKNKRVLSGGWGFLNPRRGVRLLCTVENWFQIKVCAGCVLPNSGGGVSVLCIVQDWFQIKVYAGCLLLSPAGGVSVLCTVQALFQLRRVLDANPCVLLGPGCPASILCAVLDISS